MILKLHHLIALHDYDRDYTLMNYIIKGKEWLKPFSL